MTRCQVSPGTKIHCKMTATAAKGTSRPCCLQTRVERDTHNREQSLFNRCAAAEPLAQHINKIRTKLCAASTYRNFTNPFSVSLGRTQLRPWTSRNHNKTRHLPKVMHILDSSYATPDLLHHTCRSCHDNTQLQAPAFHPPYTAAPKWGKPNRFAQTQ
jgi:hypothetical protein